MAAILCWEINVENVIILVKDHQASYDAAQCDDRNRNYIASVW
jgi:hypothetical protein